MNTKELKQELLETKKELKKSNKLLNKYAKVIAMVYDGEDVEEAERIVGLRK